MSAMGERAARVEDALAHLTTDELLARLPSCDCFDPECGYPHGRTRVGKLDQMLSRIAVSCSRCGRRGYTDYACPCATTLPPTDGAAT